MTMSYCIGGTNYPTVGNIDIRDCVFAGISSQNISISGYDATHLITDVTIANCRFSSSPLTANSFSYTNRINLINNKGGGL